MQVYIRGERLGRTGTSAQLVRWYTLKIQDRRQIKNRPTTKTKQPTRHLSTNKVPYSQGANVYMYNVKQHDLTDKIDKKQVL